MLQSVDKWGLIPILCLLAWKGIVNRKVYKNDKEKILYYAAKSSSLTVSIFRSLSPHFLWSITLPFLISFSDFEIRADLGDVMGCKEVLPGSEEQTRVSVSCVKITLRT